jgi:hypothetical protein
MTTGTDQRPTRHAAARTKSSRWPGFMSWRPPESWRRKDWFSLDTVTGQILRGARWAAVILWIVYWLHRCVDWSNLPPGGHGTWLTLPFDREGLLLLIASGLVAVSVGRHPIWLLWVALDFLPFALVLVAYDYLRGLSYQLGMPTWWHPQVDIDRALFFGRSPTVWLQEHLKHPDVRWYDVVVCLCYCSFFFLPYVMAGVMWLRSRKDFYRWSLRFVSLSFVAFALFAIIPAAPPWAAARCTSAQVASHPNNPLCMYYGNPAAGGLLGKFTTVQPGANPWVERISTRGFFELHLGVAKSLIDKGQGVADSVAAIPSLHLGGTVLFVIFMWPRVSKWWKPLLAAYPFVMTFSLVYSGEHYLTDCIAGALCAFGINYLANRIERWRMRTRAPDTLDTPPEPSRETPCPPTHSVPETTPSSI